MYCFDFQVSNFLSRGGGKNIFRGSVKERNIPSLWSLESTNQFLKNIGNPPISILLEYVKHIGPGGSTAQLTVERSWDGDSSQHHPNTER